jgi:hypothetical protein
MFIIIYASIGGDYMSEGKIITMKVALEYSGSKYKNIISNGYFYH